MTNASKFKHILIAEDNDFNQEIAVELLTEAGYTVTATNDGQQLLDALLSNPKDFFDLILMDLEMPILDGHQSTIQIRNHREFDHIPIIALTAHNLDSTKTQCAKEGMQDFLSKPFDPQALNQILEKWLHQKNEKANIKKETTTESSSDFERGVNQIASINSERGLQLSGNNAELYRKLLQRFVESQGTSSRKLRDTKESDFKSTDFKRQLHTLKGLCGTIGAEQLASDIAKLEAILDNSNGLEEVASIALLRLDRIANLLDTTITELLAFLNTLPKIEPIAEQISSTNVAQIVDTLVGLLDAADPDALDFFQTHLNEFSSIVIDKDLLAITNAIENYEFDSAISLLRLQNTESKAKETQN